MEKKTNKAKLDMFKFLRKSVLSQGYSLQKNALEMVLLGYFCIILKTVQIPNFREKCKRIEK